MEISIFGEVDLRQENKGLEHHFSDQKSSNGTMSKSSVKTLANRMTFWTKSDEMVHFRKSAPTPMDSPFLATWAISEIDQNAGDFDRFSNLL